MREWEWEQTSIHFYFSLFSFINWYNINKNLFLFVISFIFQCFVLYFLLCYCCCLLVLFACSLHSLRSDFHFRRGWDFSGYEEKLMTRVHYLVNWNGIVRLYKLTIMIRLFASILFSTQSTNENTVHKSNWTKRNGAKNGADNLFPFKMCHAYWIRYSGRACIEQ